jgi:hypothetical protein
MKDVGGGSGDVVRDVVFVKQFGSLRNVTVPEVA